MFVWLIVMTGTKVDSSKRCVKSMDSIRGLLDENTLQSIAKAAGRGVTEKQVEDVLNAVLPAIEKDSASGTLVNRTNAAVEEQQTVTRSGGTRAGGLDLLSLLLGGNTSTATQTAATNAHVSNGQASSILKIAAPILLFLLLKNKLGGSSNSGGGLLGSLLGGGSSNGSLLGSLLGGGSAQPVQQQSSANDSLLGMLLGGGNDADTSAGSSLLGSLLSDSTPAQPVQQQSAGSGSLLGSLLGSGSSQQSGGGSLLGSLLGGSSQPAQQQSGGGSLLGSLVSLLGDDTPAQATTSTGKKKKTSSTAKKTSTTAKKTSTTAKKTTAKKTTSTKKTEK